MKKLLVLILSLFLLIGCKPNYHDFDVSLLDMKPTVISYREEIQVYNTYVDFKANVLNYEDLKSINEDYFISYDLVILLVSSNAEEERNKVEFTNLEFINGKYQFSFVGKINDKSTDLAFFLNNFAFKVNKELNMSKYNININKTTVIK